MNRSFLYIAALLVVVTATIIISREFRVSKIPNGSKFQCANCHINSAGGGARNGFGQAVESRVSPNGQENFWSPSFASLDSDGDGFTNGQELGDPSGTWTTGQPGPGIFSAVSNPGDFDSRPPTTDLITEEIPDSYRLMNNYPNPFNPTTKIVFEIPQNENVSLKIYNLNGELIRTIADKNLSSGHFEMEWNGENDLGNSVTSGIYIYRLIAGKFDRSAKMILLR